MKTYRYIFNLILPVALNFENSGQAKSKFDGNNYLGAFEHIVFTIFGIPSAIQNANVYAHFNTTMHTNQFV